MTRGRSMILRDGYKTNYSLSRGPPLSITYDLSICGSDMQPYGEVGCLLDSRVPRHVSETVPAHPRSVSAVVGPVVVVVQHTYLASRSSQ